MAAVDEAVSAPSLVAGKAATSGPRRVVIVIVDISGYTRFMVAHRKALSHGQIIVANLLRAITSEMRPPLELVRLEGDAAFMFAVKAEGDAAAAEAIGRQISAMFRSFAASVAEMGASAICKCEACSTIDKLQLKAVVHSGEAVVTREGAGPDLQGLDVIVAHRLLKNSVAGHEYLLLSEAARSDVELPPGTALSPGVESYDEIGEIRTLVAPATAVAGASSLSPRAETMHAATYEILRCEVRREYAEVATEPDRGFHFHTGCKLAALLDYPTDAVDAAPPSAVESFAGTGNPWLAGTVNPSEHVVDVGCGAGLDTFIAARRAGPSGRVIGVDMTAEMLAKARSAAQSRPTVEIREGYAEELPVPDAWADVVLSNGVLNLCPSKPNALREMMRVLKPGGRLQIGDILVKRPVPRSALRNIDLWTG